MKRSCIFRPSTAISAASRNGWPVSTASPQNTWQIISAGGSCWKNQAFTSRQSTAWSPPSDETHTHRKLSLSFRLSQHHTDSLEPASSFTATLLVAETVCAAASYPAPADRRSVGDDSPRDISDIWLRCASGSKRPSSHTQLLAFTAVIGASL